MGATKVAPLGRQVAGAEVGAMLGWMSTRVLGQYDMLVIETENPEDQDLVYYVGPNVLALEKRYGFPPREFRLWLALHEVTHRMQFTGVPWLRPYFLSLVDETLGSFDPDPKKMVESLKRAVAQARAGHNPLDEGGIVTILATPEQQKTIQRIGGLMSVLEGHGDLIMDRAATDRVPSAERFSNVLHDRRQATGVAKVVQNWWAWRPSSSSTRRGRSSSRPWRTPAARASSCCGGARSTCPTWPRSATPSAGSHECPRPPPSRRDVRAPSAGPLHVPPAGTPSTCAVSGGRRLPGPAGPGRRRPAARSPPSTSTTGSAPRPRPRSVKPPPPSAPAS